MNRQENITFVIVTHSSEIAGRAGRSLMMKDGRIVND
jgi:predicted ABC-type transport system involved in lysophospholipase L1 biosynthesis ATPase subunit